MGSYSTRLPEHLEADLEEARIRLVLALPRQSQRVSVKLLESMPEHRAVDFAQDVAAHDDATVRLNSHDVPVEGGMMDLAERQTVRDARIPTLVLVRHDVGGIQQLAVPEATHCALLAVSGDHALAERFLMQPSPDRGGDVLPSDQRLFRRQLRRAVAVQEGHVVQSDREREARRIIGDDVYRPAHQVLGRHDPVKVDQRLAGLARPAQRCVIPVSRIRPAILVEDETAVGERVVVRTLVRGTR